MPLFQEKAAALKQLSAAYWWGLRSMRRRRPPPLLCGSTPQIFSRASSSDRIGCCRFPRYSSYFSSDAASRAQIASSSGDDDGQKPTAGASLSSSEVHLFQLVRPHVVEILMGLVRKLNHELDAGERRRAAATCAAIVRVLCGSPGVEKKSIPLFSEITSSDDVLSMFGSLSEHQNRGGDAVIDAVFDAVIRGYARLKMLDRAEQTFFLAVARGYVPCIDTCNFLMDLLVEDFERVEDLYSQIKRSPEFVRPNLRTFRALMETFISHGMLDEAFGVFDEMVQEGIVPDSSILSELVCGLCGQGGTAYAYLVIMKSARIFGISATTTDYNLIISDFCKMGKLCEAELADTYEAELVLEDMVKQGVPPDVETYALLIRGYCKSGNIPRVLSLLDQMDTRGIKTNSAIRGSILHRFSELGKNDAQVLELFKKYKNSGEISGEIREILDKVLYNVAIDAQCKVGKMEEAVETFQEMKGCGLVPEKIHYTTLTNGYCRLGEIDNAWKTLSWMTEAGRKPDVVSYEIFYRSLRRRRPCSANVADG